MFSRLIFLFFFLNALLSTLKSLNKEFFLNESDLKILKVRMSSDFKITGDGSAGNWSITDWVTISQRRLSGDSLITKAKVLYSETGIYFLFYCEDKKLTATMDANFMDLWKEDVVEIFLWTAEKIHAYFELPILISNDNGDLVSWMPFHYDADRRVNHATSVMSFIL